MAITQDLGLAFDDFHLEPGHFDALLAAHGTDAEMRMAQRCACWQAESGQPDPACMLCYPFGVIWEAPQTIRVYGPARKDMRKYLPEGTFDAGDVFFTLPTGVLATPSSRVVLPYSISRVEDLLEKGKEDTIRFSRVVAVEAAHYTRRVPSPDGQTYVVETVPLTIGDAGADISVSGRDITFNNTGVPDGTRYVVRLRVQTEFLLRDEQDRIENNVTLPPRWLAQRLDYFLHPRGTKEASF